MLRFKQYIAVLVSGTAFFFVACQNNNIEKIKTFAITENLPMVEVVNVNSIFTDSGKVRYTLKAPKSFLYETEGTRYHEFPEGMEVTTYDNNNQMISRITANYAKQFIKEEKWEAKNNVVVVNSRNDTLKTEHLIWDRKEKKIYTKETVKIIQPNKIIFGKNGCESDESMKKWKFYGITGTLDVVTGQASDSLSNIESSPQTKEPPR
jgi:LPS export ABC transporter protein LptC